MFEDNANTSTGLLAVFYNLLAKQRGRVFVVALCVTGILCAKIMLLGICRSLLVSSISFKYSLRRGLTRCLGNSSSTLPVQFIWLSSLALFCGGGPVVLDAMIAVIAADAVMPIHRLVALDSAVGNTN